jgi:DNA-binding PucR family transcriptional regulator
MATALLETRDLELRAQLSSLRGLLVLSMLMTASSDEQQILHLATTSLGGLARCHLAGVHLTEGGWRRTAGGLARARHCAMVEAQLKALGPQGGRVQVPGERWAWAYPLRSPSGRVGTLVVAAEQEPPAAAQFLLRVLAQQAGVALSNARLHAQERAISQELGRVNRALEETVRTLRRGMEIHQRLTEIAISDKGQEGIALAVHELTGYPVAVEDRYGNLRAWAGPNRPDPYPKDPPARREELLRRALASPRPIRDGGRLLALARMRGDVLGALALVDPAGRAGDHELVALEHGVTVLALVLAHLRGLAETELRVRRDLVEDLLAGAEEQSALARAEALGYDLERPHRVVVVEGRSRSGEDALFHAASRAVRELGVGSLLASRTGAIVVLANRDVDWEELRAAVLRELGGGRCRIGVGGLAERLREIPRSFREARIALSIQAASAGGDRATSFDQLGVFRMLCQVRDLSEVERFVREWLGALLDYDMRRRSELVKTLSAYLECGGSYDATAKALLVHRSTLKYRLQRIRELSGHDLRDPDSYFNLQLATRAWTAMQALRA